MLQVPETREARIHAALIASLVVCGAALIHLWRASPTSAWTRQAPRVYTVEQFTAGARLVDLAFRGDGSEVLFSSDAGSGIFNVHAVPIDGGGGRALTRSTAEGYHVVSAFPRGPRVLFRHDRGGNELDHLCVLEADGAVRDLTPGEGHRAELVGWARDGRSFFVKTNERSARFYDVYRYDTETLARTLFYRDESALWVSTISPDERWIALRRCASFTDSGIALFDMRTRSLRMVTPHTGVAAHEPVGFDASSRWLYYLTNEGGEFQELWRLELATGRRERVDRARWDITGATLSPGGRYRALAINEDARAHVRLVEQSTGREIPIPLPPEAQVRALAWSPDGTRLALLADTERTPEDVYLFDPATGSLSRLTDSRNAQIDPDALVSAEIVRFPSFDGMRIPALLHRPRDISSARKIPVIVYVHGGPGGQTRVEYDPLTQYLVNHGYAVFGVNNRGSSGYGKSFYMADDRKHGREPLWDVIEARRWLARQPWVDGHRIAVVGASYGGYMVLAAMAFHPGEFAAAVDLFGVSNVLRALLFVPPWLAEYRDGLYQEVGNPWDPRQWPHLWDISPLYSADRISKPLLVVQGANDARVPVAESADIVSAVRKNGVPVEYLLLPDEGHGFSKRATEQLVFRRLKEFLDREMPAR